MPLCLLSTSVHLVKSSPVPVGVLADVGVVGVDGDLPSNSSLTVSKEVPLVTFGSISLTLKDLSSNSGYALVN